MTRIACWLSTLAVAVALTTPASGDLIPQGEWVIDTDQSLVWQRCSRGQTYTDERCAGAAKQVSFLEAQAAARAQKSQQCPWRLPRFHELSALLQPDHAEQGLALDTFAFPDTPPGWYWNQASAGGHSQQDCFVDFAGMGRTRCNMGGAFHLRLVMPLSALERCIPPTGATAP